MPELTKLERAELTVLIWIGVSAILGAWLGHINEVVRIGSAIIGALSTALIGLSLVAIVAPTTYLAYYQLRRGDRPLPAFLSPLRTIVGVGLLVLGGFFFRFLVNRQFWLSMMTVAIVSGTMAMIRLVRARQGRP